MPVKSEKPKLEENVTLAKQHSSLGAWPFHLILRSVFFLAAKREPRTLTPYHDSA